MRVRGPDTGVITHPVSLSPSQAESYARCPRRYALERRLHIGDSTSLYATFGTMVHSILEYVERVAWDSHGRPSTVNEALEYLDEVFSPIDFGGEPFARSWHNRAVDTISRMYEWNMLRHEPVGLEQGLTMEVDGTPTRFLFPCRPTATSIGERRRTRGRRVLVSIPVAKDEVCDSGIRSGTSR